MTSLAVRQAAQPAVQTTLVACFNAGTPVPAAGCPCAGRTGVRIITKAQATWRASISVPAVMAPQLAVTLMMSTPRSAAAARSSPGVGLAAIRQQWPPRGVIGGPDATIAGVGEPHTLPPAQHHLAAVAQLPRGGGTGWTPSPVRPADTDWRLAIVRVADLSTRRCRSHGYPRPDGRDSTALRAACSQPCRYPG
jgi:hypothetical protein